jgi:pSer/pThr/pTyr-binding forkhead associated (FHA) protein
MIECPVCKSVSPENALFCEECGSYLPLSDSQAADPEIGPLEAKEVHGAKILILSIQDGDIIELPLSREVIIGRLDAERAIFPDVDLTNEQGIEKGLSRRHARISRREGQVFLEDLHSLNGTLLNTTRLVPDLPYPLKDGDRVQLGKLVLTVHFK